MKRLLRALIRLYPPSWRQRYGQEFDQLLDDLSPTWSMVVDVTAGAIRMQVSRPLALPFVAGVTLAGAAAGAALAWIQPSMYAATSQLQVRFVQPSASGPEQGRQLQTAVEAAIAHASLDRKSISVTLAGPPDADPIVIDVSGTGNSAQFATQITQRAVSALVEANLRAQQDSAAATGVQFRVVTAAMRRDRETRPMVRNAAAGAGLGLIGSVGVALLATRRKRATR